MKQSVWAAVLSVLAGFSVAVWAQETPPPDQTTDSVPVKSESDDKAKDDDDDKESKDESRKVTYSSIGLSRVSTDFDNLGEAINLNGGFGIRVPTVEWIAAEIGISTSIIPGENDGRTSQSAFIGGGGGDCIIPGVPPGCSPGGGSTSQQGQFTKSAQDFGVNIISVQGVLKSPGTFYGVGKYGYRYVDSNIQELTERASGMTYTIGAGYRYGSDGGVEIMYTKYADLIDGISLSISYGFGEDKDEKDDK